MINKYLLGTALLAFNEISFAITGPGTPVPEPSILSLLGIGTICLGFLRRKK